MYKPFENLDILLAVKADRERQQKSRERSQKLMATRIHRERIFREHFETFKNKITLKKTVDGRVHVMRMDSMEIREVPCDHWWIKFALNDMWRETARVKFNLHKKHITQILANFLIT